MRGKLKTAYAELIEHLPYTIFAVSIGMILMAMLTFLSNIMGRADIAAPSRGLFHVFHPIHILFSATASTAMFLRYEKNMLKAVFIGSVTTLATCALSDIFIPYLTGFLLGAKMRLHLCLISDPLLILPFLAAGIFAGFIIPDKTRKGTIFSHASHVFISSMASILYFISFGLNDWIGSAGMVFIFIIAAVALPCCMSDIVWPLVLTVSKKEGGNVCGGC